MMTSRQRKTLAAFRYRGEALSCAQLAERLGTSPEGAARSASSLVKRGELDALVYKGHRRYALPV